MNLTEDIYRFFNENDMGRLKTKYPVTITIDGKEEELSLVAGRILSLIKTNPDNNNISFDQIEQYEPYEIKKKIKKGPGGYIITDEDADKEITISLDDIEGVQEKRKTDTKKEKKTKEYIFPELEDDVKYVKPIPGSVHKIVFNTIKYSRFPKKVYTIYRKLSDQDIKNIRTKVSNKVVILLNPDTKEEHAVDVYYLTIPKKIYDIRRGSDMTYTASITKKQFDDLSADQKNKLKIRLVPLDDIINGISKTTPLGVEQIGDYLSASPFKYKNFTSKHTKAELSDDDDEEVKPLDFDLSFLIPTDEAEPESEPKVGSEAEPEIEPEIDFEAEPEEKDLQKRSNSSQEKQDLAKANLFLSSEADVLYKRLVRQYIERKNAIQSKKKEAEVALGETLRKFIDLIFKEYTKDFYGPNKDFYGLETEKQRDIFVDKVLKDKITKDRQMGLYNTIKSTYDTMKTLKESYILEAAINSYVVKTKPGSVMDKSFIKNKTKPNKDESGEEIPGEYIVGLDDKQIRQMQSAGGIENGILKNGIIPYVKPEAPAKKQKSTDEPTEKKFKDSTQGLYNVELIIAGKASDRELNPKEIMGFIRKSEEGKDLNFEDVKEKKVYNFEKKVDPKVGSNIKGSIEVLSKIAIGKGDKTKVVTTFRTDREKQQAKEKLKFDRDTSKAAKEKEKTDKQTKKDSQPEMKNVRWMGRNIKVPVDFNKDVYKIKMATPSNTDLNKFKFFLVDFSDKDYPKGRLIRNDKGDPLGTDDRLEAKQVAAQISAANGDDIRVYQRAELNVKGVKLDEELEKEDKKNIAVGSAISFTIQDMVTSKGESSKQYNITDNITKAAVNKKEKTLVIKTTTGELEFDNTGTATFTPSKDIIDNKETISNDGVAQSVINPPAKLVKLAKKLLGKSKEAPKGEPAAEEPAKEEKPETQLESYIRKRIRQAIKEAEVSQYWGYQGKDIKKKRLEDYLKRYSWGFQDSDNPYTHSVGSAMHAIVSKLTHELQAMNVDAIAIFNSYAPDGYQVTDLDQLDYASDSPLGSQLTQPYNPDSLTARGGRIAEATEKEIDAKFSPSVPMEQQLKNAEELAKEYMQDRVQFKKKNPNMHHVAQTLAKFIRKASERETQINIDPKSEILKALRVMSDNDLKK